jgi:hypothetical protein
MRTSGALLAALTALLLAGCAIGPRLIDSDVQSYTATVPAQRPASYRFERLPSQGDSDAQDRIEAMAVVALAKVDLTPAPLVSGAVAGTAAAAPTARYAVQVSVQISAMVSPYDSPFYGGFWGHGRPWSGFGIPMEPSWYRHAVRIVLRDSASGQVAYETSASFDGPWADSARLLPVILDAALHDYPNPPPGPRKVITELPGSTPEEP